MSYMAHIYVFNSYDPRSLSTVPYNLYKELVLFSQKLTATLLCVYQFDCARFPASQVVSSFAVANDRERENRPKKSEQADYY